MDPRALALKAGQALRETPEYQAVKAAQAKIDEHEAARIMLDDFNKRQEEYRQKVIAGKAGEDDVKELRTLAEIIGYNPYIRESLAAESRLSELILELQRLILEAAGLLEAARPEGGPARDAEGD